MASVDHARAVFAALRGAIALSALVLTWSWAPGVDAQGQAPLRPRHDRPVFGQPDPRQAGDEAKDGGLSLSGSLFGAYDDDLAVDAGATTPLRPHETVAGTYSALSGRLVYDKISDTLTFRADGASSVRYYPEFQTVTTGRQYANIATMWASELSRNTTFSAGGMARYSDHGLPFDSTIGVQDHPDVGDGSTVPPEVGLGEEIVESRRRGSIGGEARLTRTIGRRQQVGLVAAGEMSALEGAERLDAYGGGGVYTSEVGRTGLFRAGYSLQQVQRGGTDYFVHNVSLGGDYQRPISASRRGFVSFTGGTALLESNGTSRIFATGDATLRYAFRAPWAMVVSYDRAVNFIVEVQEPLLSDGVTTEFSGVFNRRLDFLGSGSVRRGTVGLSDDASPYNVAGGRARLRLGLSRNVAAYVEYLYFHYDFARPVDLADGLPQTLDRQTVRVGLTLNTRLIR